MSIENSAAGPLAGIRVPGLTRLLPGPVATMHLAEMGAEVLKIEDPGAALRHPLFAARAMVAEADHPSEGAHWAPAHPVKFRF